MSSAHLLGYVRFAPPYLLFLRLAVFPKNLPSRRTGTYETGGRGLGLTRRSGRANLTSDFAETGPSHSGRQRRLRGNKTDLSVVVHERVKYPDVCATSRHKLRA